MPHSPGDQREIQILPMDFSMNTNMSQQLRLDLNDDGYSWYEPQSGRLEGEMLHNIIEGVTKTMKGQWVMEQKEQRVREEVLQNEIMGEREVPYWQRNMAEINAMSVIEGTMRSQSRQPAKQKRKQVQNMRVLTKQLGRQLGMDTSQI